MPTNSEVRKLAARKLAGLLGSVSIVVVPTFLIGWFLPYFILEMFGVVGCFYSMLMASTLSGLYLAWAWSVDSARQELEDHKLTAQGRNDDDTRRND